MGIDRNEDWVAQEARGTLSFANDESKKEMLDDQLIKSLWGNNECDYVYLPSEGRSGGIIVMWNPSIVMKEEELLGAFYVTLKFKNIHDGFVWIFTFVYGATDPLDYDQFWQELFDIRTIYSYPWCLVGDWNAILHQSERNQAGSCFRLRRSISDYAPVMFNCNEGTSTKPPFRFENYYPSHPDFVPQMRIWWSGLVFSGRPSFVLDKKLQALKVFIKQWGREMFGSLQKEVDKLETTIDVLDSLEEMGFLSQEDFHAREVARIDHETT
ncbi:uncharacterized protein LOC113313043 [Papaver somniferum]|uniref:uncharacterized protein LOC113313043 n=1 Tax=Papaver somniferum TaxID=3469 RepID=UPI000E6FE88D|nr:uncharacterized protein LOC113313043 [Papaver somniferum]